MSSAFSRSVSIERVVLFVLLPVFAIIIVAVNAAYIHTTLHTFLFVDSVQIWPQKTADAFASYNVAVGVITIVTVPTMYVIDILRRGAFTSMIAAQLGILGVLDVLWLAAGANTADKFSPVREFCKIENSNSAVPNLHLACNTIQASMAFSFLNFIILTTHIFTVLTFAIANSRNGMSVWTKSVREVVSATPASATKLEAPASYASEQIPMKTATTLSAVTMQSVPYTPTVMHSTPYVPTAYSDTPAPPAGGPGHIIQA